LHCRVTSESRNISDVRRHLTSFAHL